MDYVLEGNSPHCKILDGRVVCGQCRRSGELGMCTEVLTAPLMGEGEFIALSQVAQTNVHRLGLLFYLSFKEQ